LVFDIDSSPEIAEKEMAKLKKGAEYVGNEMKKGAEFIGHELKDNTELAEHETGVLDVEQDAEYADHDIKKGAKSALNKIKKAIYRARSCLKYHISFFLIDFDVLSRVLLTLHVIQILDHNQRKRKAPTF